MATKESPSFKDVSISFKTNCGGDNAIFCIPAFRSMTICNTGGTPLGSAILDTCLVSMLDAIETSSFVRLAYAFRDLLDDTLDANDELSPRFWYVFSISSVA